MDLEFIIIVMEKSMKVIMLMIKKKEKENLFIKMVNIMKVNLKKI